MQTPLDPALVAEFCYRQYSQAEFSQAARRLLDNPDLSLFIEEFFPLLENRAFREMALSIGSVAEFQRRIIIPVIDQVLRNSSRGLTVSGFAELSAERKYVFISNHRDIVCDSALFTYALVRAGHASPQICLGDNLLVNSMVLDLVKMNKGVIVRRDLPVRELYLASCRLSEHIRSQVAGGADSVWIAQREGRAKDGMDTTQSGVIKMLAMSGEGDFLSKMAELSLVPVSISYEYDPCDVLKAYELHVRDRDGTYQKKPGEDARSMLRGIHGTKGRIHIGIDPECFSTIGELAAVNSTKEQIAEVARRIDASVAANYRLWPSNFIALDLLEGTEIFNTNYTVDERGEFIARMEKRLAALDLPADETESVRNQYLLGYANPVRSMLARQAAEPQIAGQADE